jgi:hypothetical protein
MVQERLPSCSRACKPRSASRLRETVKNRATAYRFAFCLPVPLVRKASSFCPASAPEISPPTGLSTVRRPRLAMCPTDVCHSNDLLHPHLARSRLSLPTYAGWTLRGVSGLRAIMTGGTDVSRRPNRFGGSHRTRFPLRGASRVEAVTDLAHGRGRFLPTVPDATEPLTSLSPPNSSPWSSNAFALESPRLRPFGCACGSLG